MISNGNYNTRPRSFHTSVILGEQESVLQMLIGLGGLTDELRKHLLLHPKAAQGIVSAPVDALSSRFKCAATAYSVLEDSDSD